MLGVGVGVGLNVAVGVAVAVAVGVTLGVTVGVWVGVAVAVGVAEGVAVGVTVAVGVAVTVGVGVGVPPTTTVHAENSEVLLFGSVVVAVTTCPDSTLTGNVTFIVALQLSSVSASVEPMKVSPEPLPEGWHSGLSKNSILKEVFAAAFRLP